MAKILSLSELSVDSQKLFQVLEKESDIACALIGASYLDASLAALLKSQFIDGTTAETILKPGRALGQFSDRTALAYCLGLIEKQEFENLGIVGQMRNLFAHRHILLTFDAEDVKKLIGKLSSPLFDAPDKAPDLLQKYFGNSRGRFLWVVIQTSNRIAESTLGNGPKKSAKEHILGHS